jgi:hypothetical protein
MFCKVVEISIVKIQNSNIEMPKTKRYFVDLNSFPPASQSYLFGREWRIRAGVSEIGIFVI